MSSETTSIYSQDNLNSPNLKTREIYVFDRFRLDALHLLLYENSQALPLAPKVVETLLALIERSGELVSKDQLMNRLWANSFVEESNLTQNIYLLRKTLGNAADGKPLIETFRRRGYRFNAEVSAAYEKETAPPVTAIKERWEWDFVAAEREYERAIELNPDYATAHHRYGVFLGEMGRFDEAKVALERARALDPLSLIIATDSSLPYFWSRDHERAVEFLQKAFEMDANFARAHMHLSKNYSFLGRYDDAIAEQQKAFELFTKQLSGEDADKRVNGPLGVIYATAGRKEVQKILAEMDEEEKRGTYVFSFGRAAIYAELGEKEKAFVWLEKAYAERFGGMMELKVAPAFDKIRDDPRFVDLMRRVGLPS